jgi:hypothetical protein
LEDDTHMAIGGGKGQYIVYVTPDNLTFQQLTTGDAAVADKVLLNVGGQEGDYERRFVVGLEPALQALRYFCAHGVADPAFTWAAR